MMKLSLILRSLACLLVILGLTSQPALAFTQNDIDSLLNNTPGFDPGDTATPCAVATTALTGSQNAEKIFNFLISKGLSPPQAAGFMGNLQAESGFNPRRVQNTPTPSGDKDDMVIGTSVGFGLAQWTSTGRQQNLHNAAVAANTKDSDLGVQLDYLWTELTGAYKSSTYEPLLATSDIRTATSLVMINFEAPADQSQSAQSARAALSTAILAQYGSSAAATTTSSGTTSTAGCGATPGSSGATSGSYSLPLDKKFYDQHKDWFTKPHHDYPSADIPVPTGTPVFSMTAGKIIKAPVGAGCGVGLIIDAGNNTQFMYCHGTDGGSVAGAKVGDTVKPDQLIMHSASTGNSSGPHLHVQITINGVKHCPQSLFVGIVENKIPDLKTLPTSGCTN